MDYGTVLDMIQTRVDAAIEAAVDSARQEWEAYTDQIKTEMQEEIDRLREDAGL